MIVLATGIILTTILVDIVLFVSNRILQLPTVCHLESYTNNLMKYVNLFAISYSRLSLLPESSSPPSSSTSYSSHSSDTIHAADILIDIVLVPSLRIVQLPTMCHWESCANNLMKHLDLFCCILFAIVLAIGIILTAILIDIVLIASYCTTSHCLLLRELC